MLRAHIHRELPPLEKNPRLPAGVVAVLARGLAKRPVERYRSAAEMIRALEAAAQQAQGDRGRDAPGVPRTGDPGREGTTADLTTAGPAAQQRPRGSSAAATLIRRCFPVLLGIAGLALVAGNWRLARSG